MWLTKLAWKNMWRNKHRTAITMSAVFFAVVLSILTSSLWNGVFDNLIKNVVSYYSGYIQVHKKGYWDERTLDNTFLGTVQLENKIRQHHNVIGVAPRLEAFALASSEDLTKGCMVMGISPDDEDKITTLKSKVSKGEYLINNDRAVLLGEGLANRLKLQVHDTIVLIGQGYHGATAAGKYQIKGLVKFGSPDLNNQSLFLSLSTMQELFSAEGILTSYVLALKKTSLLNSTASAVQSTIGSEYETMTWEDMMPEVVQHIRTDNASMYIIQGILYMLICFGIFGTLLMMMVERKYELGMLVAIGMKKLILMQLLSMESLMTLISGCILGMLASIPIVYYLNKYPIQFTGQLAETYEEFGFEAIFPSSTDPQIFITQGLVVLILGMLLSIYPLVKIASLNPVSAMKK